MATNNSQTGTSGDDVLVAAPGGSVFSGQGNDILIGSTGIQSNLLVGGKGQDTMTGRGTGGNTFLYNADPFDGKAPVAAPGAKIAGVNAPDTITDFDPNKDSFTLDADVLGLKGFSFVNGAVNDLKGGADVLVLQGQFANAGAAAQAIADNNALTGGAGVFIYHNSTIGVLERARPRKSGHRHRRRRPQPRRACSRFRRRRRRRKGGFLRP